ncbi:hypothetical protein [Thermomonas aquatica]|uniref:Uncharacterized protein n=1 Tax=Thermomonas aquatica TaxID=2202149 RepID=A0A5B7ZSR8_9GAMM|nr:hypothetical protein [Thermomonas aquatica]QDA58010.1 hypothetical protein FHQ07_12170 [Thermomonas aquatica]
MNETTGYAVFFFAPALEALGEAIKPYLQDGPAGPHVPCREVDTAGAFIEMTLEGRTAEGREVALELMVPGNMVRMIVSARSDEEFGFYNRVKPLRAVLEPGLAPAAPVAAAPAQDAKPGA